MGRQRNNPQMKEKEESPEKELSEMKASNLSDIKFQVLVIRMLKELSETYRELSVTHISMKKDTETLNKNKLEMKNAISEMKNTVKGIKSKLDKSASWKTT